MADAVEVETMVQLTDGGGVQYAVWSLDNDEVG